MGSFSCDSTFFVNFFKRNSWCSTVSFNRHIITFCANKSCSLTHFPFGACDELEESSSSPLSLFPLPFLLLVLWSSSSTVRLVVLLLARLVVPVLSDASFGSSILIFFFLWIK